MSTGYDDHELPPIRAEGEHGMAISNEYAVGAILAALWQRDALGGRERCNYPCGAGHHTRRDAEPGQRRGRCRGLPHTTDLGQPLEVILSRDDYNALAPAIHGEA